MTSRRRSSLDVKPRPYQINTEIYETGKNIKGSKRRIRWLFGWDNEDNQQHEIGLTHSMVSGKKEIFEDGILIFSSSSFSISEFSHGWTSNGAIFRVEASVGFSSDHTYVFSIDGVAFNTWPERTYNDNGFNNKYDDTRRNSYSSNDYNQQSPSKNTNDDNYNVQRSVSPFEPFDPFQANEKSKSILIDDNNASFDPFSSGGTSEDVFGQPNNSTITGSSSSANVFDPFASSAAPTQRSSGSATATVPAPAPVSASKGKADPFDLSAANDVFGGTLPEKTSTQAAAAPDFSVDIFGSGTAPVINNNNNNNGQSLSNQINDIFSSSNTTNATPATNNVFGAFPAQGQSQPMMAQSMMVSPSNNNVFNNFNVPANNSIMFNSGNPAPMKTMQGYGMPSSGGNPFQTGMLSQQQPQKKNTTFDNLVSWDK